MRLMKIVIETKKASGLDTSSGGTTLSFETSPGSVDVNNTSVFLTQQIDSGGDTISAKNLAVANIRIDVGDVKSDVLVSGHKSADHLDEADLTVNALLIAEGK